MVASNRIATVFHIAFQSIRKCVGGKNPTKSHFDFIYLFIYFSSYVCRVQTVQEIVITKLCPCIDMAGHASHTIYVGKLPVGNTYEEMGN